MAQESFQVRPKIAQVEDFRFRLLAEPDGAVFQIDAGRRDALGVEQGLQFQGVEEDLDAMRQLQRLAALDDR